MYRSSVLNLDIPTLNLIFGVVIPLLVGLVTRLNASGGVKAVLNAGLSALAGVVSVWIELDGSLVLKTALISFLSTWGISILTYYGLYKPTGVTASLQSATARFGIGKPTTLQTHSKPVTLAPAMVTLNFEPLASGGVVVPGAGWSERQGGFVPNAWAPGDPPLGELADDEDELDGCEIDMAALAIPEGQEALYALSPDGDEEKLKEYDLLFNGPRDGA